MVKNKALVLLYENMSMSEITLLTDYLTVFQPMNEWWEIDTVSSDDKKMIKSEDFFHLVPNKSFSEINFEDYNLILFSGYIDPVAVTEDKSLIDFLKPLADMTNRPLIAAISSAPMTLAKAGILKGVKFTAGLFEETYNEFDFLEKENVVRQPVFYDEEHGIVTAIGFAYREFAVKVAQILGYDIPDNSFSGVPEGHVYTEEELTFYMYPENQK